MLPESVPYKLVARKTRSKTVIRVGDALIGGGSPVVIAGPCAIEDEEQALAAAEAVKKAGASLFRGGAFKPRSSPYSFQGLQGRGVEILARVRALTGLPVVTEVMDTRHVEAVCQVADVLQVGSRNMQNFQLLKEVGRAPRPVLLKRGLSATIEEWLLAAEYVLSEGNPNVILCERGIRTFERYTRNTLDIGAVVLGKMLTHLPVVVDPSHAGGMRELVTPLAKAAIAAGADGVMVEVHPDPARAMCDGPQSLSPAEFEAFMEQVRG